MTSYRDLEFIDSWSRDTGNVLSPRIEVLGMLNIQHVVSFLAIKCTQANKNWTVQFGDRTIYVGNIGISSFEQPMNFIGDIGNSIAISLNANGLIYSCGYSLKRS